MLSIPLLLSTALATGPSSPISGAGNDRPGIDLHAWAEGGWLATQGTAVGGFQQHPYLAMARISSRLDHTMSRYRVDENFGSFLQMEAREGTVELLDARVELDVGERLHLRAGRFKAPVSHEFQVPAMKMITRRRPHYLDIVPQRHTGVELDLRSTGSPDRTDLQLGAFGADDPWAHGEHTGDDTLLTARVRHVTEHHLLLHAAYVERLGLSEGERERGAHVLRELDVAGGLEREDAQVMFEAVVADMGHGLHRPAYGGGVIVGRRIGDFDGDRVAFEPTVAADALVEEGQLEMCEHVGVNVFWDGWNLVQQNQVSFSQAPEGTKWTATAQIRAGF